MSDVMAEMDRAAANYWLNVARRGADPAMTIARAQRYLAEARAESRIHSRVPTLDDVEAPPLGLRPKL
jgi:hypothetical protein